MTRLAVLGFGYWGKNLIRNFYDLGVLSAVCDTDVSREGAVRTNFPGVDFCSSVEELLASDQMDGVVIATPAVTHFQVAKAALKAGKDVFVEKPLALSVEEGQELVDLAAKNHRILMVGHILQYHPAVRKLKELVKTGELGRIEYIYSNRLNIGKFRTEENILWSFAPHDISVMLSLLDEEPCEVSCQGAEFLSDGVADVTMSVFKFPSGVLGHIFVSWLHPFKEQRLVVVGSNKMAVFDDTCEDKLKVYPHVVEWVNRVPTAKKANAEIIAIAPDEPLRIECSHFIECVRSRTQPLTDGREGLRVLKVLAECQRHLELKPPKKDSSNIRSLHPPAGMLPIENLRHVQPVDKRSPSPVAGFFAHESATIDKNCQIGNGTKIWHYSHIMPDSQIGNSCIIGQNCCISPGVVIGNNVKIQNNVSVYTGTHIEDDVFLGPSCVLTNVSNPRSQVNRQALYEKTILRRGATVGANATIVCGVEIGRYAFVAAGSVVTKNAPDYALLAGNPARQKGWMSRHGHRLESTGSDGIMICPETGYRYRLVDATTLRCLDLDEESPLPGEHAVGNRDFRSFKTSEAQKQK